MTWTVTVVWQIFHSCPKSQKKNVLSRLNDHLVLNKLFSPLQSAYRPHHSTETALLKIVNDLLTALNSGKIYILTLLDLFAAFDTIDQNIFLHRLEYTFGISDSALSWFRSYLSDITQRITVNGLRLDEASLSFDVPQGSVLGPVLFVLYTQPLFELIKKHSIRHHAFADDNQLYKETVPDQIQTTIHTTNFS